MIEKQAVFVVENRLFFASDKTTILHMVLLEHMLTRARLVMNVNLRDSQE